VKAKLHKRYKTGQVVTRAEMHALTLDPEFFTAIGITCCAPGQLEHSVSIGGRTASCWPMGLTLGIAEGTVVHVPARPCARPQARVRSSSAGITSQSRGDPWPGPQPTGGEPRSRSPDHLLLGRCTGTLSHLFGPRCARPVPYDARARTRRRFLRESAGAPEPELVVVAPTW